MNKVLYNRFFFAPGLRILRHIIYWAFHVIIWTTFWVVMEVPVSFGRQLINMVMWIPAFILFGYPLVYGAIPHLLLKGRVVQFFLAILGWGAVGLYIDEGYRSYVLIPLQEAMGLSNILPRGPLAFCYLCMTTSAASPMVLKFFKLWAIKQRDLMLTQREKVTAELQLLKAQVHPHFLFNTLNNIYSFSLEGSPKTPEMILKLSSLLSYMLYECRNEEVRLEKEIEIMKNYVDLERERYGDKIRISWEVKGEVEEKFIAPLLIIQFIENAFKHGASEQIDEPWLAVNISLENNVLHCIIANGKNEFGPFNPNGIGINNVKKRLQFMYPEQHELKIVDKQTSFVVSMLVPVTVEKPAYVKMPSRLVPAPAINLIGGR